MKRAKVPSSRSAGKLPFESAPYERSTKFFRFRVGTCEGLWRSTVLSYDILAIDNKKPGNGHFTAVLEWFEKSCRRDKKILRIMHVWNRHFAVHLIEKRGFEDIGEHCVKHFK